MTRQLRLTCQKLCSIRIKLSNNLQVGLHRFLKSRGITVVYREAQIGSVTQIEFSGKQYSAKSTLLCVGSVSGAIPISGVSFDGMLLSEDVLELKEDPKHLCIIAGV